jgi:predicted 2-oxoglutarate/Fe(II)-dependent dioxygenase YbiX
MPASTIPQRLDEALLKIDRPGSFCVSGSVPAVLPGLEIKRLGPIGFPLTAEQAEKIKERCEQAPYGKGEETVVDTSVRRVWQMMPDRFQLTNPEWEEFLARTLKTVQQELGLEGQKLQAHLYNLLLYEPGSFFLPHRDGEKLDRMVATLVIVLPSSYQGGELVVRHEGQEQTIDFSKVKNSAFLLHFAAFYADCEHEIRPLREGYRLCLVYNLTLAKSKKGISAPRSGEHIDKISGILRDWSADSSRDAPRKLAIPLEHQYTKDGLAWDALKGVDAARARVLREAARQSDCMAYLALLTFHESGSAEYSGGGRGYGRRRYYDDYDDYDDDASNYEMGEVFDSSLTADHWTDDEGNRLQLGEMSVEEEEVVPPEALTEVEPEEEFEGYTGNAGMTLDRWYRHAAIFLWPVHRHFEVLCDCGSQNALSALHILVKKLRKARGKDQAALQAQCREFAAQIIARWSPYPYYPEPGRGPGDRDLTTTLVVLDDPQLIKAFLGQVLTKDYSIAPGPSLWTVCEKHGWAQFEDELVRLFQGTTIESLPRNIRLLEGLCSAKARKKEERTELCRSLADAALSALEALDRGKADWRASELNRAELLAGLARSLIGTEQPELLARLVAHALATPKWYPVTPVQVQALVGLQPWIKKHVKKPVAGLSEWVAACCEQLASLTVQMPQEPADFRREANISCNCADCTELKKFLKDPKEKVHRFPIRKERRQHLHQIIDRHQCDVTHVTERKGSPQTLVCTKTTASFQRSLQKYHQDKEHLATLRSMEASLPK